MTTNIERNLLYSVEYVGRRHVVRAEYQIPYSEFWVCQTQDLARKVLVVDHARLMPIETVPSRFSKRQFDRFAQTIGDAVRLYPDILKVNPQPLSVETFSARLRDAVTAKVRYGYQSPAINDARFAQVREDMVVVMRGNEVWIGGRDAVRKAPQQVQFANAPLLREENHEVEVSLEALETICGLVSQKMFNPNPSFFVRNLPQATLESLVHRYDIDIVPAAGDPTKFLIF